MVGVRQFDDEQVLAQALEVFWQKGLHATSMLDLAAATGVQRGSLYNAYGSKEELFLQAFERYARNFLDAACKALTHPEPKQALLSFFAAAIANMTSGSPPRGCLTTKAATEAGLNGERAQQRLRAFLDDLEAVVCAALSSDRARARLALEPAMAAKVVVTFTRGLAVMERVYRDPAHLEATASALVQTLLIDPAGAAPRRAPRRRNART